MEILPMIQESVEVGTEPAVIVGPSFRSPVIVVSSIFVARVGVVSTASSDVDTGCTKLVVSGVLVV